MGGIELILPLPYKFPSLKIKAVESSLNETLSNLRDLVTEINNLHSENQHLRSILDSEKHKKESIKCGSCESLQTEITSQEHKFESLISVIRKLCESNEISALNSIKELTNSNKEFSKNNSEENKEISPCQDIEEINEETVLEIEGTPAGRKSPIIHSRKKIQKCVKDKIKFPDDWATPEKKSIKLSFPTPSTQKGGRLKQSRLSVVKVKSTNTIDLTCSPEYMKSFSDEIKCDVKNQVCDSDTILPSPTSGPIKLPVYKSLSKDSPIKMKRQQMAMKLDLEVTTNNKVDNVNDIEESINILQNYPKRFKSPNGYKSNNCKQNESMSLLQKLLAAESDNHISPTKRPLNENVNVMNIPLMAESSSSTPRQPTKVKSTDNNQVTKVEPLYKEPTVRTKAEKRALPGWSCDECRDFFDELYKNDPVMLARKMNECSKHRGRNNPLRPNTPGGFWQPRWDVPEDTEEFNRRNNV